MSDEASASKIVWEADSTHPELAEQVRQALREVVDPELGLNVIELGLIRNLTISDDEIHINMILTTPFCPYGPALLEMTRTKGEEGAGLPATIELGMEPWDPAMMEEGVGADWGLY